MLHLWIVRRLSQESNIESSETIYFVCENNSICMCIKSVQKVFEKCRYLLCCELWHYARFVSLSCSTMICLLNSKVSPLFATPTLRQTIHLNDLKQWDQKVASRTDISKGSRCAVCRCAWPYPDMNLGQFSFHRNLKSFQDFSSHRILRYMHEALNIDENKN